MATVPGSTLVTNDKMVTVTWTLGNADTGVGVNIPRWADRTVHVTGTFGGATILIQGSNNNTDWLTLNDNAGVALSFTAAGMKVILENPLYIRASSSGGTGTDVDVLINGAGGQ
jgi:hypothetical protein